MIWKSLLKINKKVVLYDFEETISIFRCSESCCKAKSATV